LGGQLGKGAYGTVYKGLNATTGKFVAIKEMRFGCPSSLSLKDIPSVMVWQHYDEPEFQVSNSITRFDSIRFDSTEGD
jgi:hypothetical protein